MRCELALRERNKDHPLGSCPLPEDFPGSRAPGAGEETVRVVVVDYARPVPAGLSTAPLEFSECSSELVKFGNSLLHGVTGASQPKAAVVQISGPTSSKRGYLLPPSHELHAGDEAVRLQIGVKKREPVPTWKPTLTASKRKPEAGVDLEAPPVPHNRVRKALGSTAPPPDTAGRCIARQQEIVELRRRMADLVESLGPLNTRTKTGRFVVRDGYFKGLAAMYGRWVFNQKALEGQAADLDPLLPSTAPVDRHQLPKELVEAGLSTKAALQVSTTLTDLSARAAARVLQQHPKRDARLSVQKTSQRDGTVTLSFGESTVIVAEDHYTKLSNLWNLKTPPDGIDPKDDAIFCLLQRYEALSGESPGFQMALSEDVFDVLQRHWEVSHECFASPLNCYFPSYCSMFVDTDACFGSKGSFFDFFPTEGSFEANPPFVEDTMTENVRHISALLDASAAPLSFAVVVPAWDDDSCESYQLTTKSPYLRATLRLSVKDHYYKNGMQHKLQGGKMYQVSTCATFVFFLQNDAGAERWPCTKRRLDDLFNAFSSQSQARSHQGHRDIIGAASKSWYDDL